jgi:3-hydroxymyristoyl/3-hydroxydecanoyl-(acyl carrier protein) dehydratase
MTDLVPDHSCTWPVVTSQEVNEHEASLQIEIPEDLLYFEGHFEGNPVLPGVVQTHWAEHYGRALLGVTGHFSHLEVIKFQRIITPNEQITLALSYNLDKQKLTFKYQSKAGEHSSGRICYVD